MVWGYEWLKLSKEYPRVRYPRVGVNAQLLKIKIPAVPAYLLARHEAHQLYGLLPADVVMITFLPVESSAFLARA